MLEFHALQISKVVDQALQEDWAHGDWTTDACVPKGTVVQAKIVAKTNLVVAGLDVLKHVFHRVNPELTLGFQVEAGQYVEKGSVLLTIFGCARSVLKAERVALNFFARLCGVATHTYSLVKALEGTETQLLDTRKTTPGLRIFEKAAVAAGGGRNHRWCLMDGVLIKENHIRAAGGLTLAIDRVRGVLPPHLKVEVETTCFEEVQEAVQAGAEMIMLDNMPPALMAQIVQWVDKRATLEASGNITLDNIREIAETGVNFISTSAMFHSSKWADLSLLVEH
ncbi:MAG: carboxylating nicotinate-nucleotide diphosphorylase [Oligoflexales bacterium]